MTTLFISYRRRDTAPTAGRLHDRLSADFGSEKLFFDVDSVGAGEDFVDAIDVAIEKSDVILFLIGKYWLFSGDQQTSNSLDNPKDYVRREIAKALSLNKLVVPVLVDGVKMPEPDMMPIELSLFSRCNALNINNSQFNSSYLLLCEELKDALEKRSKYASLVSSCGICGFRKSAFKIKCPNCRYNPLTLLKVAIIGLVTAQIGGSIVKVQTDNIGQFSTEFDGALQIAFSATHIVTMITSGVVILVFLLTTIRSACLDYKHHKNRKKP